MKEKLIEKKLRAGAQFRKGIALKLIAAFFTGLPDRLVLIPVGRLWFVETKTTGERLSPRQKVVHALLRKMGFEVRVISTQELLDQFFQEVDR